MTERSMFWDGPADGSGTGDASIAEYDAATEFSSVLRSISGSGARVNQGGVFFGELNNLAVTSVGTSPVSIASGRAIVLGTWYENTASVNIAVATPGGATRIDTIVLRKDWTAQTVRVVKIDGAEGGGAPALTQILGTTWEIPLADVSITTGGIITLTDRRETGSNLGSGAISKIKFDVAGGEGASGSAARESHIHEIDDPATPTKVASGAGTAGTSVNPARDDHGHPGLYNKSKTTDETAGGTVSDADLRFAVLNGERWNFEGFLIYDTADISVDFSVPGGSALRWGAIGPNSGAPGTIEQTTGGSPTPTFGGDGTVRNVYFRGTVLCGGNGTVILTWGTGARLYTGSYLIATRV